MNTTPSDMIRLAFKDSMIFGVGQTPNAEDTNDGLDRLNMLLAQWNVKRWLVFHLVTTSKVCTGAQSYTVGPGMDFDIPRPDKIQSAFFRQVNIQTNPPDYPLQIILAREDYNLITMKNLTAFPQYLFYDAAYPTGVVYPWPVPQANIYEVHITTKAVLSQFTDINQTINLPPEYYAALFYNLCERLRPAYGKDPDQTISAMASDALNVIRMANAQIPLLQMPDSLVTRGVYDPYSDRVN